MYALKGMHMVDLQNELHAVYIIVHKLDHKYRAFLYVFMNSFP